MLIYNESVYRNETNLVLLYEEWAKKLAYVHVGLFHAHAKLGQGPTLTPFVVGMGRFLIGYVNSRDPGSTFAYRCLYLLTWGGPDFVSGLDKNDSDNLATIESIVPGEPMTLPPTTFPYHRNTTGYGPFRADLANRLKNSAEYWRSHAKVYGLNTQESTVERLGREYQ